MAPWLPILTASRITLTALGPWPPAAPFLAEGPAGGSDVLGTAAQTVLGYGVVGAVALVLAWIVYKGKFTPQERVDELVAASRADLLRELESVRADLLKTQEQRDSAMRMATDQLVPLLTSFVATSQSLIPLLQELVRNRER